MRGCCRILLKESLSIGHLRSAGLLRRYRATILNLHAAHSISINGKPGHQLKFTRTSVPPISIDINTETSKETFCFDVKEGRVATERWSQGPGVVQVFLKIQNGQYILRTDIELDMLSRIIPRPLHEFTINAFHTATISAPVLR